MLTIIPKLLLLVILPGFMGLIAITVLLSAAVRAKMLQILHTVLLLERTLVRMLRILIILPLLERVLVDTPHYQIKAQCWDMELVYTRAMLIIMFILALIPVNTPVRAIIMYTSDFRQVKMLPVLPMYS